MSYVFCIGSLHLFLHGVMLRSSIATSTIALQSMIRIFLVLVTPLLLPVFNCLVLNGILRACKCPGIFHLL